MKRLYSFLSYLFITVVLFVQISSVFGQTNPTAQALPYTQTFSTFTGTTTSYPAGWQGWTISGSLSTSYSTAAPLGNHNLAGGSAASTTAGVYDMNNKLGLLNTSSALRTAVLAVNTSGLTAITVSWDAMTMRTENTRTNGLGLQYRIGTSGTFTNVSSSEYQNVLTPITTTGTTGLSVSSFNITLPAACENQSVVQLRWVIRDITGSGNRPSFAIDNVNVSGTSSACTAPTTQASAPAFANVGTTQLDISGNRGNGDGGLLIIGRAGSAPTDPLSGTSYTGNNTFGSGSSVGSGFAVFNSNPATTYSATITNLAPETRYFFSTYEWNATGTCYNTTENSGNQWTLSTEPTAHSGTFTCNSVAFDQINNSFGSPTLIGADGYVILRRSDGTTPTTSGIVDGVAPGSWTLPSGTVIAGTSTGTSFNNTGLSGSTSYGFLLIPYNWNGSNAETYNYRTAATVPSTTCTTPAAPSTSSDIILSGMAYTSNIDYTAFQAAGPLTNTSGNVGVMGITIRDGGTSSPDADGLPTILTGITFSGITGTSMIRTAALFEGNALVNNNPAINTGSNTIAFSGLNYSTADNGTRDLTLRVSFLTSVTDNLQMTFSVSNANVTTASGSTSSQMSAFSTVNSSTIGDRNRIEVTATKIAFQTQPSTTTINATMSPAPTVRALDANNNLDLDYTTSISISSSGTMTSDPISVTPVNGVATFSSVVHTVAATTRTLTASSGSFSTINSTSFDIVEIVFVNGDYRTTGSGTWTSNSATPAIWERLVSGVWTASNSPTFSTTNTVFIQNGHAITTGGSFGSSINLAILQGGTFNCNHPSTTASIQVYGGGTLNVNAALTNNGNFQIDSSGTCNYAYNSGSATSLTSTIWNGTEIFKPQSNFIVKELPDPSNFFFVVDDNDVSTNTNNSGTWSAMFGNLIIDMSGSDNSQSFSLFNTGITKNLTHNDFIFRSSAPSVATYRISSTGTINMGIGHDLITESGFTSTLNNTTSGDVTLNIKGNLRHQSPILFRVTAGSTSALKGVFNIDSSLFVTNGGTLTLNATVTSNPASATINLKGNLTVDASSKLNNANNGSAVINNYNLNFTGTDTQRINSIPSIDGLTMNVKSGALAKLESNDLTINNGTIVNVETSGTLDFSFSGNTPLLIKQPASPSGSNFFNSRQGSTLRITSPGGIIKNTTTYGTTTGNVQNIPMSNRDYNPLATFWYIGRANQVTGDGINQNLASSGNGRVVICDMADNTLILTPTVSFAVTNSTQISPTGGKLDIRKGQFIETETAYITGSDGTLYMAPGTLYKIVKGNSTASASSNDPIPRMSGTGSGSFPYVLTGGTIELAGSTLDNYFQTLRGDNANYDYHNVTFSGSNTYLTNYKNLNAQANINDSLYITGSAVVDCINGIGNSTSFVGNGGLVMDGGRIRLKNVSNTQPELVGDNTPYILTGGTVEFYGSSATQQQQMRGNYRSVSPVKISYYNVDINAAASNYDTSSVGAAGNVDMVSSFLLKNAFNIYSPAVFRMDESDFIDDAASPSNSFTVNTGAGLLYGNINGITSSGATGNVRISGTRNFLTTASYGFVGNNTMASGNGLPATVASLYVYRNNIQRLVNLTNSVSVTDSLNFYRGIISTGANKVTMLNGDKNAIKNFDPPFTGNSGVPNYIDDRYVIGNLERNINSTGIYVFPVGDAVSGEAYNPLRFSVNSGSGMATAQFIPGDPGSCVSGPVFFTCDSEQKGYSYSDMTTEGRWRMTSSTGTTFDYGVFLHPNVKNLNIAPNVWIDSTGTNYLIDYRALKAPNGTTDWSTYAGTGDVCVSSYYYNIFGDDFSGFSDFAPAGGNTNTVSQLPVELISFNGECQDDGSVMLNWTTASEQNSSHYVIEQSTNGTQFSPVMSIPAAGNSKEFLSYKASVPVTTDRTYYRLTIVDLDNTFEYSPVTIATCASRNSGISVYYSPEEGVIMQSQLQESSRYQLSLFDATGKLLMQENKVLDKGMNRYSIDIRKKLAKGIYFFRASNGTSSLTQKIWVY